MTLPAAFAAERRRRVPTVDRYSLQAPAPSSKPAARRSCLRDQRDRGTDGRTDGRTDGHPTVAETLICGVNNAGGEIDRTTYVKSVKSESVDMERSSDGVDAIGDL